MISFGVQVIIVLLLMNVSGLAVVYRHVIVVSNDSSLSNCTFKSGKYQYHCGSLAQTFDLLNKINASVDVTIEPDYEYSLESSYNLTDLQDVRISSVQESLPVNISCRQGNDDGISFIKARNLLIQYLHIKWCGMVHVSTSQVFVSNQFVYFHSALYFQNSTDLNMTNVKIYNNNGIGVVIIDCNGTISITHSEFSNNSLNPLEQSVNFAGGGGLYIEFTKCTPGLPNCNPKENLYNHQAKYFIDQCTFEANNNAYINSEQDQPSSEHHITFGCGGGLTIWLFGNASHNVFYISSNFSKNKANRGGGFSIDFRDNSAYTNVTILRSNLTDNKAHYPGGAGAIIGYAIYHFYEKLQHNHVKLTECNFTGNIALNGSGGGLGFYGSREPNVTSSTNYIEISKCHFEENLAQFGSALAIAKDYYEVIPRGVLLTFIITSCTFIGNNVNNNMDAFNAHRSNSHSRVGAIAVIGFNIQFRLSTCISHHNTTALVMDNAIAEFYNGSTVIFTLNSGLKGGAILLLQGSWLKLFSDVKLTFQNNTAIKSGGAIFVEMISPFDFLESHICFMRHYNNTPPSNWNNITIEFINNSNPTLFASTLHPCDKEYNDVNFLLRKPFSYSPPINKSHNIIATLPNQIHVSQSTLSKSPGRTFELPVYLTDELNQNVNDSIFIVACNSGKQGHDSPHVVPLYQYTNGSIQIVGKPTKTCYLELQTDNNYQVTATITVHLSKCPPGYIFDSAAQKCDCLQANYKLSGNPVILHCDPLQFQAYVNPAYWVGFKEDNATTLVASPCPFGYCYGSGLFHDGVPLIQEANKTLLDQHVCGNMSRTSTLCGKCIENHSVAMNSLEYSCHDCKHYPLGAFLFIAYYIIPVTIVFYLIMTYNLRVTSGLFGAFLFFAQIIGSETSFAFNYRINGTKQSREFVYSKFLISLYKIFNLELFQYDTFSYCLIKNAGAVDILAVKLLASLYPLGLVVIYSLVRIYCNSRCLHHGHHQSHHCHCLQHCQIARRAVPSGLSAFFVLCFAKINVLAFAILKPVNIEYFDSDGKWKSYKTVVYLQGSLEYFHSRHIVYSAVALILLTIAIAIPTALLLIHPLLLMLLGNLGMGESGLMKCIECCLRINKLRPVLDSFQGDYKNSMKFFAGLHFFLYKTIVLCILIVIPTSSIGTLQLILIALFLIIMIIHIIANPFRNQLHNIMHSLLYLLIIVLFGILYLFISDEGFSFATYLGTVLFSLPLLSLGVYTVWILLRKIVFRIRHIGYIHINNLQHY